MEKVESTRKRTIIDLLKKSILMVMLACTVVTAFGCKQEGPGEGGQPSEGTRERPQEGGNK